MRGMKRKEEMDDSVEGVINSKDGNVDIFGEEEKGKKGEGGDKNVERKRKGIVGIGIDGIGKEVEIIKVEEIKQKENEDKG